MLWYKSWMETRWRFLIGLAMLTCSACVVVFLYPQMAKLIPLASTLEAKGVLGREIREAGELARDYRGYVWGQWYRQNLPQLGTLFAALLGTGGLLSESSGRGMLFTLSLPASRKRLLGFRAAVGLAEFLVLAFVPSLFIPLLSPAVGETYGLGNVLIHSACQSIAGAVFFSLAFLLSTMFHDLWRPLLITLSLAAALALFEQVFRILSPYNIFRVMSAEVYFRTGQLPWLGLLTCAVASAAMLYGATISIARHDF